METINPESFMTAFEAFILVCSTSCLAYLITRGNSLRNFRLFMDAFFGKREHLFRCSLCLGLWIGLLNGAALILSKDISNGFYLTMIAIDSAWSIALLVFIINLIIRKLNANERIIVQVRGGRRASKQSQESQ